MAEVRGAGPGNNISPTSPKTPEGRSPIPQEVLSTIFEYADEIPPSGEFSRAYEFSVNIKNQEEKESLRKFVEAFKKLDLPLTDPTLRYLVVLESILNPKPATGAAAGEPIQLDAEKLANINTCLKNLKDLIQPYIQNAIKDRDTGKQKIVDLLNTIHLIPDKKIQSSFIYHIVGNLELNRWAHVAKEIGNNIQNEAIKNLFFVKHALQKKSDRNWFLERIDLIPGEIEKSKLSASIIVRDLQSNIVNAPPGDRVKFLNEEYNRFVQKLNSIKSIEVKAETIQEAFEIFSSELYGLGNQYALKLIGLIDSVHVPWVKEEMLAKYIGGSRNNNIPKLDVAYSYIENDKMLTNVVGLIFRHLRELRIDVSREREKAFINHLKSLLEKVKDPELLKFPLEELVLLQKERV